ncbi:MAG: hypothetical protein JWQ25_992 [Daejeonella sp.]|nr:hypothetical protein [Daejeonella sp.]
MIRNLKALLTSLLGFALGIEVKILFAPFAKRLQQKARPNAQSTFPAICSAILGVTHFQSVGHRSVIERQLNLLYPSF